MKKISILVLWVAILSACTSKQADKTATATAYIFGDGDISEGKCHRRSKFQWNGLSATSDDRQQNI